MSLFLHWMARFDFLICNLTLLESQSEFLHVHEGALGDFWGGSLHTSLVGAVFCEKRWQLFIFFFIPNSITIENRKISFRWNWHNLVGNKKKWGMTAQAWIFSSECMIFFISLSNLVFTPNFSGQFWNFCKWCKHELFASFGVRETLLHCKLVSYLEMQARYFLPR